MDTTRYDTRGDGKDGARQRLHFRLAVEEGHIDMHVEIVARTGMQYCNCTLLLRGAAGRGLRRGGGFT